MTGRRRRPGWLPDPIGALLSFLAEALVVAGLAVVTIGVAAIALWLV
ncbi:MAG: hypothetical protein BMS9Abin07_2055 [Acidimicrobiia bacterium]|nr:MAG: hypothetical protein BMS9Abin07_2055 [Acidimicrobiia bacterium]